MKFSRKYLGREMDMRLLPEMCTKTWIRVKNCCWSQLCPFMSLWLFRTFFTFLQSFSICFNEFIDSRLYYCVQISHCQYFVCKLDGDWFLSQLLFRIFCIILLYSFWPLESVARRRICLDILNIFRGF